MHFDIKIVRENPSALSRQTWRFTVIGLALVLDGYYEEERATKRHKYITPRWYSRLNTRDSKIREADVPWSTEIMEDARALFLREVAERVRVGRWCADFGH
jgi:hypothetical protein